MPGLSTLTELTTQVRRRADMEDTLFVSDDEIQDYIQESYLDGYEIMIESSGPEAFMRTAQAVTTSTSTPIYALSEASEQVAMAMRLVRAVINVNGEIRRLAGNARPEVVTEGAAGIRGVPQRASLIGPTILRSSASDPRAQLLLDPAPDAEYTVTVYYIPFPPDLTTNANQNLLGYYGLQEYVVCDAAAKCLEKEETDARHLWARREKAAERIRWGMRARVGDGWGKVTDIDEGAFDPWDLP